MVKFVMTSGIYIINSTVKTLEFGILKGWAQVETEQSGWVGGEERKLWIEELVKSSLKNNYYTSKFIYA